MSETISQLSEREIRDLCAFADGSLPAARQAEVEAWVAASPELRELVARQRRSLAATDALTMEPVPAAFKAALEERQAVRARPRRRLLGLALSAAGVLVVAATVLIVLSVRWGPADPSVLDAVRLALQPATGSAPRAIAGTGRLAVAVEGLPFPDYSSPFGWRATGVRAGRMGGRDTTIVYYERAGQQMAYAIVAAPPLARPAEGKATTIAGVQYQTLTVQGRSVVTWRRLGHTCVIVGSAPPGDLLALASGEIAPY